MTLVSFVCQQACLFFSEGVRFSDLLNQTGRFVPGSQPDVHTGGGSRHKIKKEKKRATPDGDALLLPVPRQSWLGCTLVDVRPQLTSSLLKIMLCRSHWSLCYYRCFLTGESFLTVDEFEV